MLLLVSNVDRSDQRSTVQTKHDYIRIAKKRDSPSGSACNVCWKPTAINFHWLAAKELFSHSMMITSLFAYPVFYCLRFSCLSVIKTWQINKLHVSFLWRMRKYLRPPREEIMHLAWHLFKALFTRRGVTLACTHLFLFSSSCLQGGQGYSGGRVTLSAC